MNEAWLWVKLLHILSSTLLLGAGLGTAFSLWRADRGGDMAVLAAVARNVVIADWTFTAPAVLVQPATGLYLIHLAQIPLATPWVVTSLALYAVVGACWLPVVWIQLRVARLAAAAARDRTPPPAELRRLMSWWYALGWPAFAGVIAIFGLMVFKPAIW